MNKLSKCNLDGDQPYMVHYNTLGNAIYFELSINNHPIEKWSKQKLFRIIFLIFLRSLRRFPPITNAEKQNYFLTPLIYSK